MFTTNTNNTNNNSTTFETIKTDLSKKYYESSVNVNYQYRWFRKFLFLLFLSIILFFCFIYLFSSKGLNLLNEYENIKILFFIILSVFIFGILFATYNLTDFQKRKMRGRIPKDYNPDNDIIVTPYVNLLLIFIFGIIAITILIYSLSYGMSSYPETINIITTTILILACLIPIYFIYLFFTKKNKSGTNIPPIQPGFIRLIKNISIYSIICFPYDVYLFIKNEYNNTPKKVYYILLIEIMLIVFFFLTKYLRDILLFFICHDAIKLLNEPIYLDSSKEIGTTSQLYGNDLEDENYNYNYAISFWYYLNPKANDDSYYNILTYNGKPLVEYNQHKNKLRIKMKEGREREKIIYLDKNVETQKWNNMVINYQSNTMDIFINNVLVSTTHNEMPYMSYDNIMSGSNNGIEGGICNVLYFKRNLSINTINLLYYLCKYENPPII